MSPVRIERLDHESPAVRQSILDYLAPVEPRNLFLVANLTNNLPGSHVYAATRDGRWNGMAAYYDAPRSVVPFCSEPETIRELVRHIVARHSPVLRLNGFGDYAWPAYELLLSMELKPVRDPRHIFMERALDRALEHYPHEEEVRSVRSADGPQIARLLRYIWRAEDDSPVTEQESSLALLNPFRLVIERDGRIVATAATNGLGLKAFQILGVATHPDYRRHGYARAVCAALIRQFQNRGARHCVLFTGIENEAGRRCYEGMGFKTTGDFCVAQFEPPPSSP